jgi:hypothetical protein
MFMANWELITTFKFKNERMFKMLFTIAAVLVVLWLLGFVSSYTFGGLLHILLVVALIVIIVGFLQGRRTV